MERNVPSAVTWGYSNKGKSIDARFFRRYGHRWYPRFLRMFRDIIVRETSSRVWACGNMGLAVWANGKVASAISGLDVCAGTNDVGIRLLKKEPGITVTAIDRSQEMQEEGQR